MDETPEAQDYTIAYEPDFKLKKTIGENVPLNKVFTPEKIAAGNKIIEDNRSSFFDSALVECEKLLVFIESTTTDIKKIVPMVASVAASIKGESEIYDFVLVQKICAHIMTTCADEHASETKKRALLRDLAQALLYAVKHQIKDDGGEAGKALLADMSRYRAGKAN